MAKLYFIDRMVFPYRVTYIMCMYISRINACTEINLTHMGKSKFGQQMINYYVWMISIILGD